MSEKSRPERECRNRMRSDHPRLCLWYIKYDWKRGATMKDDDDDFIDDLIAYKIITDEDKKSKKKGSSGGCLSWILVIIGIVLVVSLYGSCTGKNNKPSYSSSTSTRYTSSSYARICWESGCRNTRLDGGNYCSEHTCATAGCLNRRVDGSKYCSKHKTSTTKPVTTRSTIRSTEKKDPYNISSYDDIDDFYDDWYDDFDGFDDAEMYWDDHH